MNNPVRSFWGRPATILLLWCALLTLLLYGRSLFLPFFFDDLDHMPYTAAAGLNEIWRSSGDFPYYRPLGGTVWRLLFLAAGEHNPLLLHGLNLLLHTLNGWLVARIAGRFFKRPLAIWGAATVFLVFPFSYQAVPWIGALYHLLVTTLVLGSLLAAAQFRASGQPLWLGLALGGAFLAPFAHENGIVTPLLAAAYFWLCGSPVAGAERGGSWRPAAWFLLPAAAWLAIWLAVPKGRAEPLLPLNWEAVAQNGAYFLQGITFPLTAAGGWLRDTTGGNDLLIALLLGLLGVSGALWLAAGRSRPGALFGLIWFAAAAAPAILLLPFAYVISAPRLLMLPAAGAAFLWAGVLEGAERRLAGPWHASPSRPLLASLLPVALLMLITFPAAWFVNRQVTYHEMLGRVWRQGAAITRESNENGRIPIFVNLPSSITAPNGVFPLGHEGVVFMVPYIPLERIMDVQVGETTRYALRRHDDIRPRRAYLYDAMGDGRDWPALTAAIPAADIWIARYEAQAIWLEEGGRSGLAEPAGTAEPLAQFPETGLTLLDGRWRRLDGGTIEVDLVWQADGDPPADLTVFVQALDDSQPAPLLGQADGLAWGNTLPPPLWPGISPFLDRRRIVLEIPPTGDLSLVAGLYSWQTGARQAAFRNGTALPHEQITIPPE